MQDDRQNTPGINGIKQTAPERRALLNRRASTACDDPASAKEQRGPGPVSRVVTDGYRGAVRHVTGHGLGALQLTAGTEGVNGPGTSHDPRPAEPGNGGAGPVALVQGVGHSWTSGPGTN